MKSFQIVNKFELNAGKYLSALLLATIPVYLRIKSIRRNNRFTENIDSLKTSTHRKQRPLIQQLTETFYPSQVDHAPS